MKTAGEIISVLLDRETAKNAEQMGKLFSPSVWSELLESCNLSQGITHSRIKELERSILQIEADHPGWIQLLQTKQRDLLDAVRRRFPEIHFAGISFRLSKAG